LKVQYTVWSVHITFFMLLQVKGILNKLVE
jgi:hypothetical protein